MSLRPDDAAASLDAIAAVEQRTRHTLAYGRSSACFILWGVLLVFGYSVEQVFGFGSMTAARLFWGAVVVVGFIGTAAVIRRRRTADARTGATDLRLMYGQLVMYGYGWIFVTMLWPLTPRQLEAFWPNVFMLGFVIAGLWLGRFFVLCGALVTALSLVGYVWAGDWFPLWMAATGGGGLIAGGLWLRRVGAPG
jgi:hypothetical protein